MLQGYEIRFNIYANSQDEVDKAREALVGFINQNARCGRAVTALKIAEAVSRWDENPIVMNRIIKYLTYP